MASGGAMKTASPFLRLLAAVALVVAVSAIPIAHVAACSCMPMVPGEAAAMADAAFTGTVVAEQPVARDDPAAPAPMGQIVYTFEVDGIAKGDLGSRANILAGGDSAGCGMSFAMNERWLIFASAQDGQLATGLCSANVPLAADEEPPISVSPPTPGADEAGAGVPLGVVVPGAAVVAFLGLAAFLFWRADRPAA
jgi:Tissue inhibitor of metalloproteinase